MKSGKSAAEEIAESCDERVEELRAIAQQAADDYWTMRLEGNKDNKIKRKSNIGCRIIPQGSQFSISWYSNTYNTKKENVETYSTHLRKGRTSHRYSDMVLQRAATDWELEYVMAAESIFGLIREELNSLAKVRRALLTQKRLASKLEQALTTEDLPDE